MAIADSLLQKLDKCQIGAEMLYARLLAKCDTYGTYYATPEKINGRLFEKRHIKGETTPSIIAAWLIELENNGLIKVFDDSGERYLNIVGVFNDYAPFHEFKGEFPVPYFIEERIRAVEAKDAETKLLCDAAGRITDFINETAKKYNITFTYRHSKTSRKVIIPRMRDDGYLEQDLKLVVEHKCMEWLGSEKMMGYVRPITLFKASNFDGYLNAARVWAANGKRQKNEIYRGKVSDDDYGSIVK